jgi:peptide/nickel transport system substrate-binding protein
MNLDKVQELFDDYQRGKIGRREFIRLSLLVGGAAAAQALIAACSPGATSVPPTAGPTPAGAVPTAIIQSTPGTTSSITPQRLIYAGGQDAPDMDPSNRTDYSIGALSMQVYDRLFRYESNWPQPIDPCLCTKYEVSPDSRQWTFHLTDKAKFHDGSPVTAEAVRFSVNRTLALQKPRANNLLPIMDMNSVKAVDNTTVQITLTNPYAELPRALDQPIMNPKVVTDHNVGGDQGAAWLQEHEAGSGPFTIKSWTVGTAYELEAVPDYWQGWPGAGRLSGFIWRIIRETSSQRIALLAKEVDVIDTMSADDFDGVNKTPGFVATSNYGNLTGYMKLNNQKEPTSNPDFRQFMAYAFDYDAFKTVLKGFADILKGPVPVGHPYFDPSVGNYTHDLVKAKAALDKTPWKNGGISLDFVYVTGLSFEEQMGLIMLDQLSKFNIKVNMVPKVWPEMVASCKTPATGSNVIMIFTGYTIPDQWFSYQWYSPNWDRPTGGDFNNCSFFKDPSFNKLVETVRVTTDETQKKAIYSQLQKAIHDQAVEIPVYVQPNILGWRKRVQGYKYFGAISVDFWRLWIDDSKG